MKDDNEGTKEAPRRRKKARHSQEADKERRAGDADAQEVDRERKAGDEAVPAREPPKAIPIAPAPQPGGDVQVAMGMQLMMQRSSFDSLSKEVQKDMIRLAGDIDQRGYDYACKSLAERSRTRKWAIISLSLFAILIIGTGTYFANLLLKADKFAEAQTLIMTGIGVIGALLGGAGLQSVFRNISGSG